MEMIQCQGLENVKNYGKMKISFEKMFIFKKSFFLHLDLTFFLANCDMNREIFSKINPYFKAFFRASLSLKYKVK